MLTALLETGLHAGLTHILTVLDVHMERIVRRAGCPIDRLCEPRNIGGVPTLAILMECTEASVAAMHRKNNFLAACVSASQLSDAAGRVIRERMAGALLGLQVRANHTSAGSNALTVPFSSSRILLQVFFSSE